MSFMQPVIERGPILVVETGNGTEVVPCNVCRAWRGANDRDKLSADECYPPDIVDRFNAVRAYVEGRILEIEYRADVFYGRYSAPGYMDCTSWHWAETEKELRQELDELYGDDLAE